MSLTGYLLSDGITDLSNVFININEVSLTKPTTFQQKMTSLGNVDLSGCFIYGRNDGYAFDVSINSMFPVGYTTDISNTLTDCVSGTIYSISIPIYSGTWLVNYGVSVRGNSTYSSAARLVYDLSANSAIRYTHNNTPPKYIVPFRTNYINTTTNAPISIITTLVVSSQTTLEANASLSGVSGNTIYLNQILAITKIA
jgi:hypothetical protein